MKRKNNRSDWVCICYMLHLNKRSCIVTNLIGIQWFTRESIVSRHGMARGDNERLNRRYKRKWNAAMNESANWKTLFFLFSPSFAVEMILSRSRSIYTCQRCACRCKFRNMFSCVLRGYLQTFCSTWKIHSCKFRHGSWRKRSIFTKWTLYRNNG